MKIGVLALQGAFFEHINIVQRLGFEASAVRLPQELEGLDGIIIPGGESTTISRLMTEYNLMQPVREMVQRGLPILGTCAGTVLLAREVPEFELETLGLMDIKVRRNAFGSQVDSFETELDIPVLGELSFHAVFIRAPIIEHVGSEVEILASLSNGVAVAARQENLVVAVFHPELTIDTRFHEYFLDIVAQTRR